MSGIIGYYGSREAKTVLLDGLSRLEYRGYDSAGIATLHGTDLCVAREVGGLENLARVAQSAEICGNLGIGHTRWATHGEPTHANAHPHADCDDNIAVVHNGIIENYLDLKEKLQAKGHVFRSETDSEVIAHLVEDYTKNGAATLEQALLCALIDLKGTYAIAIISRKEPDKIIAARNGSPLLVGLGEAETFIASDVPAIIPYTRKIIFLEDYQIVVVEKDHCIVKNMSGHPVDYVISHVDWDVVQAQKDGYDHFMLKEIHEQPAMIKTILAEKLDFRTLELTMTELEQIRSRIVEAPYAIIQACGSSYHAGLVGEFIFEYFGNLHTDVEVSSEFRYKHFIVDKGALIVSITQSGETADTLVALRKVKRKGISTFTLCNVVGSSAARDSDAVSFIHAGPEIGVVATKSYTAQLFSLCLTGIFLGHLKRIINRDLKDSLIKELSFIPVSMRRILDAASGIEQAAAKYAGMSDFFFLGRGINYASALEGALKLKEVAGVHATAYPAGEMKHGPLALVHENTVTIAIAPQSATYEKMLSHIQEIKARRGSVIAIATEGDKEIAYHADDVIYIPAAQEIFSPLLVALPLQLLAYYIGLKRGCNIDRPRNQAKAVTVE